MEKKNDRALSVFIWMLILALIALGTLTAIGVIGDKAQAETNSTSSGYSYNWSYLDWNNDYHYAIQYIDEIGGGASCSGYLEAHRWKTDEETGEDVCMLCGYVHQEETPEGVKINTVTNDNSTAEDNLILPTAAIITTGRVSLPIRYTNPNVALNGEFEVYKVCFMSEYSKSLLGDETPKYTQMKYWGVDDYGNVTYEFIDEKTGAIAFAHEGDFGIIVGDVDELDRSAENQTPASAIAAATVEEVTLVIPESKLELSSIEVVLHDNDEENVTLRLETDNSVAEDDVELDAIVIPPEKLNIHFVTGCDVRKLLEKDLQMVTSVLILEDVPIVGEPNQDNG